MLLLVPFYFHGTTLSLDLFKEKSFLKYISSLDAQLGYGDTVNRGDIADSMGDNLSYIHLGTGVGAASVVAANHFTCVLLSDLTIKWVHRMFHFLWSTYCSTLLVESVLWYCVVPFLSSTLFVYPF